MSPTMSMTSETYRRTALRMRFSAATSWIGYLSQAWMIRSAVDHRHLLAWLCAMVFAELCIWTLASRLHAAVSGGAGVARRRHVTLIAGLVGSGSCWGLSGLLPGLRDSSALIIANTATLVVVGAFSVHNLSLDRRALAAFSGALLLPSVLLALVMPMDGGAGLVVGLGAGGSLVMVQIYGMGARKIERGEIAQRFRVAQLVEELTSKNEALAAAMNRLTELAAHDPLTGCLNRRAFAEQVAAQQERAARLPGATGVLVVDVDFFKRINDAHGHEVGDGVLVELSRRIRAVLRESDAVARWGGEEFVCLVEAIDEARLGELAERLRLLICGAPFVVGAQRLRVSVSVGAAVFAGGEGFKAVVDRADQALYRSKREGRNRVTMDGVVATF